MLGLTAIRRTKHLVKAKLGVEVELIFSQKTGCGMCPCSPGYMIKVEFPKDKAERVRSLFSKYQYESLTRRTKYGKLMYGLSFHGEVRKGWYHYGLCKETN